MTVVIGTAGHIDHGKTTLLRALTGIDADRLPEERRRGMTIDVGYAHLALDDGTELDFVDVPGHDRLVGNMLVGAGEIDAALLVVAADDGPRAQTLEHLELLDAIGIRDAVAALTKVDLVDEERRTRIAQTVTALLAGTALAGAPVVGVSAASGEGLGDLRIALLQLRDAVRRRPLGAGPTRLAIDRTFTISGRGLVVTGTLRGGALERGTSVRLLPADRSVRIRDVQVHGRAVARAEGGRTAVNLAGIEAFEVGRGMVLAGPGIAASDRLLVALRPPPALGAREPVLPADGARLRLHLGTAQVRAVVARRGRFDAELPGEETSAILRLEGPVAAAIGDRFVLRRPAPGRTEAGGRVLDPLPPDGISRRRSTPDRLAALAVATGAPAPVSAAVEEALLELHGARRDPGAGPARLAPDVEAAIAARAVEAVLQHHLAEPSGAGMRLAELRTAVARDLRRLVTIGDVEATTAVSAAIQNLVGGGRLVRDGDRVRDPARRPAGLPAPLQAAMDRLEAALAVPAPPSLSQAARAAACPADGIRALEAAGRIVRLEPDLAWAGPTYRALAAAAVELASRGPLTPAALRDATGTSRKYVLALLEDLDRRGALRRTPDGHVPGPRSASLSPPDGPSRAARSTVGVRR